MYKKIPEYLLHNVYIRLKKQTGMQRTFQEFVFYNWDTAKQQQRMCRHTLFNSKNNATYVNNYGKNELK